LFLPFGKTGDNPPIFQSSYRKKRRLKIADFQLSIVNFKTIESRATLDYDVRGRSADRKTLSLAFGEDGRANYL
jgi:hypothetical protein